MNVFIANLIDEYVEDKKILDENFVLKILDKILVKKQLTDLASENHVYNFNNTIFGSGFSMEYTYPNGISVYIVNSNKEVLETIKKIAPSLKCNVSNLSEEELLQTIGYCYFIKIVMMLFHEVEHVSQNDRYGRIDSFEDMLVSLNLNPLRRWIDYKLNANDFNEEYESELRNKLRTYKRLDRLSFIEPIERFANIKSSIEIKDIINCLNTSEKIKEALLIFVEICDILNYTYSYIELIDNDFPLKKYVEYMKSIGEYSIGELSSEEIDKMINDYNNNLYLNERLYYGFEITKSEFNDLIERKIKIL